MPGVVEDCLGVSAEVKSVICSICRWPDDHHLAVVGSNNATNSSSSGCQPACHIILHEVQSSVAAKGCLVVCRLCKLGSSSPEQFGQTSAEHAGQRIDLPSFFNV